jgi:RNA recognition motif-containing protein
VPDEKEQEEKPLQEKPVPHSLDVSGASGESTQHSSEQTQIPATDGETKKPHIRAAAGKVWKDTSLSDWPENDYRLFVGNLSKDVTDPQLYEHFAQFPSLQMVKVIRDPKGTSKGYGFVSLMDPIECAIAIREMDQTWLSSRPIKVKRSDWKDRELKNVKKKQRQIHRKMNRSL